MEEKSRSRDIADHAAHLAEDYDRVAAGDGPLFVTRDGQRAGVVMSVPAYERMLVRLAEAEKIDGLRRGLAQAEAGETIELAELKAKLRADSPGRQSA